MNAIELSILLPAFVAGLIVLSTHVPLGAEVLRRGIIFIDLAIAQVAGLGVIAADRIGFEPSDWMVQVSAVSAALLVSLILNWTNRRWPEVQEALIGICFVMAAAAGILLLAGNPHGGENLRELLVGQILWVTFDQLIPFGVVNAVILGLWFRFRSRMNGLPFYILFAFAVTSSVQLVGIYLVFGSLIIPALATLRIERRFHRLTSGYVLGSLGFAAGLALSAWLDLPSGAVIVWTLAAVAVLFGKFNPWTDRTSS
ncbi:MAG: metal ABC transporter permease [Gammaproteobacteria bacterium]|nr:metal ABC transporter permease [Gammaproteobacteria bacterium]MDH4313661.1 metal ABC transporter permease [Gammaproteobacteria bacterium]MDH5215406.1 metal ABC transporter permease [Gammaproteobacteria bacterium]MDH5500324.1 metal ABC transporter permease [Gammaproteobacteria bacterium]